MKGVQTTLDTWFLMLPREAMDSMVRNFVKYFKILWKYIIKCYKSPSIFGWAFLSLLGLIQLWSSRWLQLQLNCSFWHFVWQGKWTFQTRRGNNIKACITICVFHQVSEICNYLSSILWLNVVSHFFFRSEKRWECIKLNTRWLNQE